MMKSLKRYFSFFGILISTVNRKIHSFSSMIESLVSIDLPKITKHLLSTQLKPLKLYSSNDLKHTGNIKYVK